MKLAPKIALVMVALVGLIFALGGFILISANFGRTLNDAIARSTTAHLAGKETLRRQLTTAAYAGATLEDYDIAALGAQVDDALASQNGWCAVLNERLTPIHNSLPSPFTKNIQAAILGAQQPTLLFYRLGGSTYLAFGANLSAGGRQLELISVFNLSSLFAERTAQLGTFTLVYGAVLLAVAALAAGVGFLIAWPLRQLSAASRHIAAGAYSQRTGIARQDEIGELAASFDEMAAAVQEKVDTLKLSVQQREDFMAAFTHELKTPMTSMMGYAALLKRGTLSTEETSRALDTIHGETRRLEALSQKLLALLGLSDEHAELEPTSLDDLMETVRAAFSEKSKNELVLPKAQPFTLWAEPDLLADLLINLVRNAFAARPADGKVRLTVADDGEEHCVLSVTDTGCGIPPQALARLSEPFYRPDPSRARAEGGSGLGLALCARIAALHGTQLHFESTEGSGTAVSIRLRLYTSEKEEAPCA